MLLLSRIKEEIKKSKIISFDIFDTLLLRPYVCPTDVFLHIEKIYKRPFFRVLRQEAEHNARRQAAGVEDISLDDIYEQIDEVFKPLQKTELEFEEMVLRANPELKQVYDYAKEQNKQIIIASDMYLPDDFLAKVLRKNGFDGFDRLYVSGNIGKTKGSGNLYRRILADFPEVSARDILHIGDNKKADCKVPQSLGIRTVYYQQLIKRYIGQHPRLKYFAGCCSKNLGASVLLAMQAYRWQQQRCGVLAVDDYWAWLGYNYGGPVAYSYSRFLEAEATRNKLSQLLFVARDGYVLQKVFNSFNNSFKNDYVYAPRFLNLICRLDYARKNRQQSMAIINFFAEKSPKIRLLAEKADLQTAEGCHRFIQDNKVLFGSLAGKQFENYKNYLGRIVPHDRPVGVVDTRTGEFSSQKLIQNSLHNDTYGLYWSVINMKYQGLFHHGCYIENSAEGDVKTDVFTANWNFIEFLITSPEYPIKNITERGEPVYESKPSPYEIKRVELYPTIAGAIVDFAEDVRERFDGHDIFLDAPTIVKWVNYFADYPEAEDIKQMADIKFGVDSSHSEYIPLFSDKISLWDMLRRPGKTAKILKKLVWRTPLQSLAICLLRPLAIRKRGLKKIKVVIFPRLRRQYFTAKLKLNENWHYEFLIGNIEG